ncbi:DNA topoisomerase IV subunit A [Paraburkholderia sp. UCT31]|uniref:DNA topoisomerase IV subunit A n=1 Tax=Paraburkholderia sp. UCT31 TaxID=2615209 RepID=UPI001654D7E0|nr:DNA topoisomerase IV subunit A [Paraburkholderia sp. UCT31]MBC8737258.1 DNA topoisomerase IV subunit A [Paraburkholderia sp. UCT31]
MFDGIRDNDELELAPYAERSYLDYAVTIVKGRSLPGVNDGQKPVQRRILYAMNELGLGPTAKTMKSARVVGDVLGKYHPHGDQSAYDALVRLAQDFSLRYPIIDGQGNFGSRDGDGAAAMRYTECRLTPFSEILLSEVELGTVDWRPNYDGTMKEPEALPARLPVVLLNGFSGIAVGMAGDLPPHNLREIADAALALLKSPDMTVDQLVDIVPGPDLPDGGQLAAARSEVVDVYATGRGSLRMRARWRKEELARGQWRIVVYELPYMVSCVKIATQIEAMTNPQVKKDKKSLSPEQKDLKDLSLSLMEEVRDESSKDNKIRLVIEPRSSRQSPEDLMNFLFVNTDLEANVVFNANVIDLDQKPKTMGLKEQLQHWLDFRFTTVTRRSRFELDKANDRIHILEGRHLVFLSIDEVIKTIRESDEPKPELMQRFALSERQAEDILEIRLRQLARLEGFKLEQELAELRKKAEQLNRLLGDDKLMRKLIADEIKADRDKFGDDRRTLIQPEARAVASVQAKADEACTIVVSKNLWARRFAGHDVAVEGLTYKPNDTGFAVLRTTTNAPVAFLDSNGRAYSVLASDVPAGRGDGVPLTSLIDVQNHGRILHALAAEPTARFVFATDKGLGFIAKFEALIARPKAGKDFINLKEAGGAPLAPVAIPAEDEGFLACGGSNGKMSIFPIGEINALAKGGKGVLLMFLDTNGGETLACAKYFAGGPVFEGVLDIKGTAVKFSLKGDDLEKHVGKRARKGAFLPKKGTLAG